MAQPRNIEREERERRGVPADDGMFVTWKEGDAVGMAKAMTTAGRALASTDTAVYRTRSAFYDMGGDVSVRNGFGRGDHNRFRPGEGKPKKPRDRILASQGAYDEFGIVRNIMDTMTDFTVQGISLVHPNQRIQQFMQEWFYKVQGPDVSSHIALNLFLEAAAPILRETAKLKKKDQVNLQRGIAADSPEAPFLLGKKEIPWGYTVLNPCELRVLGGGLAPFIGRNAFRYEVEIDATTASQIRRPKNDLERELIQKLPEAMRSSILAGSNTVPIDPDQLHVLHYKRRHWQTWATPMTYPLLDDLNMLRKLKLADLAALDGAISHIRIWRLGSLEHRMMPTRKAMEKLADMLANAGNGVSMDLVWGPDLDLQETSTEIHRFLGEAKYAPHLNAIYAGYGIPPTLTGAAVGGGFTNNFISLKTLTERLQYVRRLIREFWEYEISLVQQAFGFRLPATVRFDRMVLTDEAAEKALLVQLADRDLISVETIQERFGEDPVIEEVRQRQEARKRASKKLPRKASPWHKPEREEDRKDTLLNSGVVAPSEVGVTLDEKKAGEETGQEHNKKNAPKPVVMPGQEGEPGIPGQPQQGRPRNSKDTEKRKQKQVKIRTKAKSVLMEALAWTEESLKAVAELTTPVYLKSLSKKNLRQLTSEQSDEFEKFKFAVLVNLPPGEEPSRKTVAALLGQPLLVPTSVSDLLRLTVAKHVEKTGKEPSVEKLREYQTRVVALYRGEFESEGV